MTWDQIPLSWRNYLKFSLEMASFAFTVGPLMAFLRTKSFADVVLAALVCIPLLMISLVIMRIVEKERYEVLREMKRGTTWLKP